MFRTGIDGGSVAAEDDASRWRDEEIGRLQALVSERVGMIAQPSPEPDADSLTPLIERLEAGTIGKAAVERIIGAMAGNAELAAAVAALDSAGALSSLVERWRQRTGLDKLTAAVLDPTSTTEDLEALIRDESWIFGGRYAPAYAPIGLAVLDQLGVPLIRSDGAIHLVQAEAANLPDMLYREDGRYVVGAVVHAAVDRAIDRLRLLDEHEDEIRRELMLESRRALSTVVIGHPEYLSDRDLATDQGVRDVLRTYDSHLAGIELITYQELLEGAERVLMMSGTSEEQIQPTDPDLVWSDES